MSSPSTAVLDGTANDPGRDRREANAGPAPSILPLDVRAVGIRDLPGLRRLDVLHRLNQPETQLVPYSPLRAGLGAAMPGFRGRRPAFVACAGDRLVGFAQFVPVPPDQRWLLIALGASVGVFDAEPVWDALLTHAVRAAGLRGVKRLYARAPHGVPVAAALRGLAWAPYASETIYAAHDIDRPPRRGSSLRPQQPSDTWAIHQLYSAAVPREVQYAEAYTSHHWDARAYAARQNGATVGGWLIEEGHHLIGYARASSRAETHVIELVYHPERIEVLNDLIPGVLAALPDRPARRVYCAVRGYQAEAATALEVRGFAPMLEQELLVKYTTASVRLPAVETVPFHVEVRDKLPQRVPSFLHGQPRDESAT